MEYDPAFYWQLLNIAAAAYPARPNPRMQQMAAWGIIAGFVHRYLELTDWKIREGMDLGGRGGEEGCGFTCAEECRFFLVNTENLKK